MNAAEIISLIIGSGIGLRVLEHFLTRKFEKKKATTNELDNIDHAVETWQKIIDKLETRIENLLASMKELRDENITLKEEVYQLREELTAFKQLQKRTERYEKKIKQLEDKVIHYERLLADNGISF